MNLAAAINVVCGETTITRDSAEQVLRETCDVFSLDANNIPPYPKPGCILSEESYRFWIKLWLCLGVGIGLGELHRYDVRRRSDRGEAYLLDAEL